MRVWIDAENDSRTERVRRLVNFLLSAAPAEIGGARLSVGTITDPLGTSLTRCLADIQLRNGEKISVEEIQSDLELAVSRALKRSLRTVQRRRTPQRPGALR